MSRIQIVSAGEEDLSAISDLAREIWHACYPEIITTAQIDYMLAKIYSLETLRSELRDGIRYEQLILEKTLAGFASFGKMEDAAVFKLHKLYLHPNCQGRGFGSQFLKHCEAEAQKMDARHFILNVNKRNTQAIAVYRKNGYTITDSVILDIGNGFVMDDYVMCKSLI